MDNTRIRNIIRESIDKFLFLEFDEGKRLRASKGSKVNAKNYGIYGMENQPIKIIKNGEVKNFEDAERSKASINAELGVDAMPRRKRKVVKSFYDADTENASQLRRTIRSAWDFPSLQASHELLSKFAKQYGVGNAQTVICGLYGETQKNEDNTETSLGLFTQFNQIYDKLDFLTTEIEGYGADIRHIKSRLLEMPFYLNKLHDVVYAISERSTYVKKLLRNPQMMQNAGITFNPRIISGYITSSGLDSRVVYQRKDSTELQEIIKALSGLAEYIENAFRENNSSINMEKEPVRGITTIRK